MSGIKHLAIIMDGNGRWAKAGNMPVSKGHEAGALALEKILSSFAKYGIPFLSAYAFSYENWGRSEEEVSFLTSLLDSYLINKKDLLKKNDIKFKAVGRIYDFKDSTRELIKNLEKETEGNKAFTLYLCLGYGGRPEIVDACRKIIESGEKDIGEADFKKYLYAPEMPDVDLLIRTGGVYRVSNFLLWQIAYAELYFFEEFWPDFSERLLSKAIGDYSKRTRTFGGRIV